MAVVVTFKPSGVLLEALLRSIDRQVALILVIENTALAPRLKGLAGDLQTPCEFLVNAENSGIGHAHNQALHFAISHGFDYLLILDQDSLPAASMVSHLLEAFSHGTDVAAVGPTIHCDTRQASTERTTQHARPAAYLISSGTLLRVPAAIEIGGFRAQWFIDHIDHDWCMRARWQGYKLLRSEAAVLHHRLGDRTIGTWLLRKRRVAVHAPWRNYFQVRNALFLARTKYTPISLKALFLKGSLGEAALSLLLERGRYTRLKAVLTGIRDGLCKNPGPIEPLKVCGECPNER